MKTIRFFPRFSILTLMILLMARWGQAAENVDAGTLWADSLQLEQNSDYVGALDKMSRFGQVSADAYLFRIRSAWLQYMSKHYDLAEENYLLATEIEPTALAPVLGLVYTYWADGKTQKAKTACRQVLDRDPLNYTATKILAAISYEKGDFAEAARNYQTLLRAHPEDVSILSGVGWSLLKLNKKQQAAACFQRLLLLSPDYSYAMAGYQAAVSK